MGVLCRSTAGSLLDERKMTRTRIDGIPIIEAEPERICEFCGKRAEARPYGEGGKEICHPCMNSSPERVEEGRRRFHAFVEGGK